MYSISHDELGTFYVMQDSTIVYTGTELGAKQALQNIISGYLLTITYVYNPDSGIVQDLINNTHIDANKF